MSLFFGIHQILKKIVIFPRYSRKMAFFYIIHTSIFATKLYLTTKQPAINYIQLALNIQKRRAKYKPHLHLN